MPRKIRFAMASGGTEGCCRREGVIFCGLAGDLRRVQPWTRVVAAASRARDHLPGVEISGQAPSRRHPDSPPPDVPVRVQRRLRRRVTYLCLQRFDLGAFRPRRVQL
jgi:hypothetical protein